MSSEPPAGPRGADRTGTADGGAPRTVWMWRVLSALLLLAMGGIHLYLALNGTGGVLGVLFVANAFGAVVLAIAIVVLREWLLRAAAALSLVFMAGTLLALVLALTVGLFGIRSSLDYQLAPTTLVVESIGTVVLAATVVLLSRPGPRAPTR